MMGNEAGQWERTIRMKIRMDNEVRQWGWTIRMHNEDGQWRGTMKIDNEDGQ